MSILIKTTKKLIKTKSKILVNKTRIKNFLKMKKKAQLMKKPTQFPFLFCIKFFWHIFCSKQITENVYAASKIAGSFK